MLGEMFACGTTDTPGCVMYEDGTCSCARNAGVAGACGSCAQKMVSTRGAGAPAHGGGHGGGGHGGHGGGGGHMRGGGGGHFGGGHFGGGHRARHGGRGWGWSGGNWVWGDWWPVYVIVYDCPPGYFYDVFGNCVPIATGTGAEVVEQTSPFPLWPILAVGAVAVGIFIATLSIKPHRR